MFSRNSAVVYAVIKRISMVDMLNGSVCAFYTVVSLRRDITYNAAAIRCRVANVAVVYAVSKRKRLFVCRITENASDFVFRIFRYINVVYAIFENNFSYVGAVRNILFAVCGNASAILGTCVRSSDESARARAVSYRIRPVFTAGSTIKNSQISCAKPTNAPTLSVFAVPPPCVFDGSEKFTSLMVRFFTVAP